MGLPDHGTHTIWEILDQEKEVSLKLTILQKTLALIHCWGAFACLSLTFDNLVALEKVLT